MDFTKLTREELEDFLTQFPSRPSNRPSIRTSRSFNDNLRANQLFERLMTEDPQKIPPPVVDLWIVTNYQGPVDQRYTYEDISRLSSEDIQTFGQIFGLDTKDLGPTVSKDHISRILRMLGLIIVNPLDKDFEQAALIPTSSDSDKAPSIEIRTDLEFWKKYRKVRKLGSGGFGQVILVKNKITNKLSALKQYKNENEASQRELLIFIQMQQLGITKGCGLIELEDALYIPDATDQKKVLSILIEYVPGKNLKQAMSTFKEYSIEESYVVLRFILTQLVCLHDAGLIHRDIKLENIIYDQRPNNSWPVRLVDYGFVCSTYSLIDFIRCDSVQNAGTVDYLSPEALEALIKGRRYVQTFEDDIWALGIVIVRMRTLDYWKSPKEATLKELRKLQIRANALTQQIQSNDLGIAILPKMLAKNPKDRLSVRNAFEMVMDLVST